MVRLNRTRNNEMTSVLIQVLNIQVLMTHKSFNIMIYLIILLYLFHFHLKQYVLSNRYSLYCQLPFDCNPLPKQLRFVVSMVKVPPGNF